MDINKLVENYFAPKNLLTKEKLWSLFDEVLSETASTQVPVSLLEAAKTSTFTISMIPDIEVSELGWSDMRTPDQQGASSSRTERENLQAYLDNIVGPGGLTTLKNKLSQLSNLANNPAEYVKSLQESGASNGEKIRTVISFLVFYKTLTKVIANFNASSAGFSFESFLATLLGGEQIPASGATTIADFTDSDGEKISLKLYKEKRVEVGGSFDALVGDLIRDGKMTYLVTTKDLRGSREKLAGHLTFYVFDFTLDNVMEILKDSGPFSARSIILPLGELGDIVDVEVPEKVRANYREIQELFRQNLAQKLENQELVDQITSNPHFVYGTDEMFDIATGKGRLRQYAKARGSEKRNKMEQELKVAPLLADMEDVEPVMTAIRDSLSVVIQNVADQREARAAQVADIVPSFGTYKLPSKDEARKTKNKKTTNIKKAAHKSAAIYAGLSEEDKKRALLKTNGYLNDLQFSLNRTEIIDIASNIGTLEVGTQSLQTMLDSSVAALNTDIFSIFSDLEGLSNSLNTFFAGGLVDTKPADTAIEKATSIEGKTKEAKPEK